MKGIANSFSLQMVGESHYRIEVASLSLESAREWVYNNPMAKSAIGHADTAKIVSAQLGREIPANRVNLSLEIGDELLVAQFCGGRLPEGCTQLPEGCTIEYKIVRVEFTTPKKFRADLSVPGFMETD